MVVLTILATPDTTVSGAAFTATRERIRYRRRVTALDPAEATAAHEAADAVDDAPRPDAPAAAEVTPSTTAEPEVVAPEPTPEVRWADPTAILVPEVQWVDDTERVPALTWVDPAQVAANPPTATLDRADEAAAGAALMRGAKLRPAVARPRVLVPLGVLVGLVAAYAGTTLLWPLHEIPPTVAAVEFATTPADAATLTWPAQGSAGVGIAGMGSAASALDPVSIASVTKVVSALMVLDRMPLALGEQGPEFSFTRQDNLDYWSYRRSDQSALDVPVGGVLTEYQMLQGTLLGSANNYIDRLSDEIWGSDQEFAQAAQIWLSSRGFTGVTVVTPSGFDERNVATPEALVAIGEYAMRNPVFAEIVGTRSVNLPGAGEVTNTNGMLADPGVVGIKTGTLVGWNLLTAKDVTIDDTTVHLFAAVLNQQDDAQRLASTRSLFAEMEAALNAQAPTVPQGTVVGQVETEWGETVDIVTESDARVVLWAGASATATPAFDLGDVRDQDGAVGTLTTAGPLNTSTTTIALADDIEGPSAWWRLTHPLELLGLDSEKR